jgi:hypothetical protein
MTRRSHIFLAGEELKVTFEVLMTPDRSIRRATRLPKPYKCLAQSLRMTFASETLRRRARI